VADVADYVYKVKHLVGVRAVEKVLWDSQDGRDVLMLLKMSYNMYILGLRLRSSRKRERHAQTI